MTKHVGYVYVDWVKIEAGILEEEPNREIYILIVLSYNKSFVWLERMNDSQPLTLLFSVMRAFQAFLDVHHIEIKAVITDKKPSLYVSYHRKMHAFERVLIESKIKHIAKDLMDDRMIKFEQILHTSLLEEGPYCNREDFETYLVDFMSYYNHPDISQLFPENEVLTDLDVDEEAISAKLEQLLERIDDEYDQEGSEEMLKITQSNEQMGHNDVFDNEEDDISLSDLSSDLGLDLDTELSVSEDNSHIHPSTKISSAKKRRMPAVWQINEKIAQKKMEKTRRKKRRRKKKIKEFDLIF